MLLKKIVNLVGSGNVIKNHSMITDDKIRKIQGYKTWSIKRKVDELLQEDAFMYTNLGIDSTTTEKKKVKAISRKIYKAISIISPLDGYILEAHMNEKDLTSA